MEAMTRVSTAISQSITQFAN